MPPTPDAPTDHETAGESASVLDRAEVARRPVDPSPVPAPRSTPEQPGLAGSADRSAPDDVDRADEDETDGATAEPDAGSGATLTERERAILAFEQKWWRHAGAKEQGIRDAFDLSATRYYQILNGLLDNPAALVVDPVLVRRLRRLRAARSRTRRR